MSKKALTAIEAWDTAVELDNVTKYFDQSKATGLFRRATARKVALESVSFAIQRGEFVAYAGPNGAGKSTTFKLACGMLAPQAGAVRVMGREPMANRIPIMRQTGVLFGNRSELWWDHPVRTSFEWKRRVWDIPASDYSRMLAMVTSLLGLNDFMDSFARELSLGQRMRANLGLMLLHEPALVLLDEPTLGLDVLAKRQMMDFLKHINRENGTTILVTSHDMDDLAEMARRLILIHRGCIAFDGAYERLLRMAGDRRQLRFTAAQEPLIPHARLVTAEHGRYCFEYDANTASVAELLRSIADVPGIGDVETGRVPIETMITEMYQRWATEDEEKGGL